MSPEIELVRRRRKRVHPLRRLVGALGWIGVLGVLALTLPEPFGARIGITVVSGDSMLPTYQTGDAVLTWRSGDYDPGTPIVYAVPGDEVGAGVYVVHRIVEPAPEGYVTQGDNNRDADPWRPTDEVVQGRVLTRIPHGAFVLRWMASPLALGAASGMFTVFAVLASGTTGRRHRKPPRRPPRGPANKAVVGTAVALAVGVGTAQAASLGGVTSADLFAVSSATSITPSPVTVVETITSDQPLQYCATIAVTNPGDHAVAWRTLVDLAEHGADAVVSSYGVVTDSFTPGAWRVSGEAYHAVLAAGASTEFGYCASRPVPELTEIDVDVDVTVGGTQFCASITASTTSEEWVRWRATLGPSTPGLTAPAYRLAATPSDAWGVQPVSFAAGTGTWVVRGAADAQYVRAGTDVTFGFCAPLSTSAPLVESPAVVTVTSSGGEQYCTSVTVTTASVEPVRWQVTIGHATPAVSAAPYWLDAVPTNLWNATSVSFSAATGDWVVRGSGGNEYISAAGGATWGYCAPTSTTSPLTDATVSVSVNAWPTGYCASVTVSTTSPTPIRWRATIDRATPGLTAPFFWLGTQPSNVWNATTVSFSPGTGTWLLRGAAHNDVISAGSPADFGYCVG